MHAIVFHEFGEPARVLQVEERPLPEPSAGQVRVRMLAAPVNPSDLMTVRGIYGKLPELPATPGYEGVGVVEASGGGLLGSLLKGKRVSVLNSETGSWGEHAVVSARQAIPLPSDLSLEQAAMFFINPATAYVMTRDVLRIPENEWLVQTAAGSALGRMVIGLGQKFRFRTLNVVRNEAQVEELKALGADEVLVFSPETHSAEEFAARIREAAGRRGVGYAIDPVGGATGSAVVHCLGPGGKMLVYGTLSSQPLQFSPRALMTPGASITGFWLSNHMANLSLVQKVKLIGKIKKLTQSGILVAEAGQWFGLNEIAQAVGASEEPGRSGKVLLKFAGA